MSTNQFSRMKTRFKTSKGKHCQSACRDQSDNDRIVTPYESPLVCFNSSWEEFTDLLGNTAHCGKESCEILYELNKQNSMEPWSREPCTHNNTILIDSDNELSNADKEDSIIECSSRTNTTLPLQQRAWTRDSHNEKLRKRKRSSVILLDDSSSAISSDTRESQSSLIKRGMNGENIAPLQKEDDVIELWSCLGDSSKRDEDIPKQCKNKGIDKSNFSIDTRPNFNNLDYPNKDDTPIWKRRKKMCSIFDNVSLPIDDSQVMKIIPGSRSKTQQTKRWNGGSGLTNPTQSNAQLSKKKITYSSDKKNSSNSNRKLREIIVDGCNVAMLHTNGQSFSEKGILLIIDYFKSRGHVVKVFLPQSIRKRRVHLSLEKLYKEGTVIFTPSRYIAGRQITPYDDRYILDYATKCEGVVISSDQYRDLYKEKPEWRNTILNRLLAPTFVGDYVMFPEDPLGKSGPNLETFLRH